MDNLEIIKRKAVDIFSEEDLDSIAQSLKDLKKNIHFYLI